MAAAANAAEQQRAALLALGGVAAAVVALSRLQVSHLLALLIVSLWAAGWAAHAWFRAPADVPAAPSGGGARDPAASMRFLPTNSAFLDVLRDVAPLKRFDRARFEELGRALDAFQRMYVYIMSGRAPVDVEGLKALRVDINRTVYSMYLVVPKAGKHFYGDGTLWGVLDAAIKKLQETLETMVTVVVNHAEGGGVPVPNDVGVEPANRGAE